MTTHLLKDFTEPFLEQNPVCSLCVYSDGYDLIIGNYFRKNILKDRADTTDEKVIIDNVIAPKFVNTYKSVNCVNTIRGFKKYTYDDYYREHNSGYYNHYDGIYISNYTKQIIYTSNHRYKERLYNYLLHLPVMETLDEVVDEIYYAVTHPDEFIKNNIIKLRTEAVLRLYHYVYDKLVNMVVKSDSDYIAYNTVYTTLMNKLLHINMCNMQDDKWTASLEALLIDDEKYNIALDMAKIINYNMPIK